MLKGTPPRGRAKRASLRNPLRSSGSDSRSHGREVRSTTRGTMGWHPEIASGNQDGCSNDDQFPAKWTEDMMREMMFRSTAKACCDAIFGAFVSWKEFVKVPRRVRQGPSSPTSSTSPSASWGPNDDASEGRRHGRQRRGGVRRTGRSRGGTGREAATRVRRRGRGGRSGRSRPGARTPRASMGRPYGIGALFRGR